MDSLASIGTLYPILTRLRQSGLIVAFEQSSDAGPVRKYYRPTQEGIRQLDDFRHQRVPFVDSVSEMVNGRKGADDDEP